MAKSIYFLAFLLLPSAIIRANGMLDYGAYHTQVIEAEKLIISEKYSDALFVLEKLFDEYDFVFLREYQVATQLALHIGEKEKAIKWLKKGILAGWALQSTKKNDYLASFRKSDAWKVIMQDYNSLRAKHKASIDKELAEEVRQMFVKDQWKAIGALLRFTSKWQDKYAEKKFAPHSEKQIAQFSEILKQQGYPGEQLISNDFWASTILSHHNSISQQYTIQDTLYMHLKPHLMDALLKGQISPHEFAIIDEWYISTKNQHNEVAYGLIQDTAQSEVNRVNQMRANIFLRSVETRNQLIDIEDKTGMYFYINQHSWIKGKIGVAE